MNKVSVSDIEGVGANLTDEIAALLAEQWALKTLAFRLLDEVGELQSQVDRVDELLFGTDQPLDPDSVDVDGLNELFCKLRAAIKGDE